jgi:SulP family sulfate permease
MTAESERNQRRLARWLPGVALLADYPRAALRGDLVAGASVALVTVPSAIACAELIGLPPVTGLYASIGGMAGYALLGTARRIIVAPDPAIAVLAGSAILPLAAGDPARAAMLAAALAMITGALLVIAARVSAGTVADLLSKPVLTGYLNGVALILIGTQLGRFMGITLVADDFFPRLVEAARKAPTVNVPTVALGAALILLLFALRRMSPRCPGTLVACIAALVVSTAFDLPARGVAILGRMPLGLPSPHWPAIGVADARTLLPAAIAIAFLAFAEGVVLARALAAKHREGIDANRELVAFGAASMAAGALGGFPVNASQSRSAIADASGARTQLAQMSAALLLALFVLFLAPSIERVPLVALAAILVFAGLTLLDTNALVEIRRFDRRAFWHSVGVTVAVLVLGLVAGLLLGIALSLVRLVIDVSRPRDAVLRRLPDDRRFHDLDDDQPGTSPPGVLVYRMYAPLIFANARHFSERVRHLAAREPQPLRCVVFDLQAVATMDVTASEIFHLLCDDLIAAGVDVRVAHANRPLREQLLQQGVAARIGEDRFFHAAWEAVDDYIARGARSLPPGPHSPH